MSGGGQQTTEKGILDSLLDTGKELAGGALTALDRVGAAQERAASGLGGLETERRRRRREATCKLM